MGCGMGVGGVMGVGVGVCGVAAAGRGGTAGGSERGPPRRGLLLGRGGQAWKERAGRGGVGVCVGVDVGDGAGRATRQRVGVVCMAGEGDEPQGATGGGAAVPAPAADAAKPAADAAPAVGEDGEAAKAAPAAKGAAVAKGAAKGKKKKTMMALPEFMEEVIPRLKAELAEDGVKMDDLQFVDRQLRGVYAGGLYTFWVFFPEGNLTGMKGWSFERFGIQVPSTVEPFINDEKFITPELFIFWVRKRLKAYKTDITL